MKILPIQFSVFVSCRFHGEEGGVLFLRIEIVGAGLMGGYQVVMINLLIRIVKQRAIRDDNFKPGWLLTLLIMFTTINLADHESNLRLGLGFFLF